MFKPNLKLHSLKRIIQLDRYLASSGMFDEDVMKKRIAARERSTKSADLNKYLNNLKNKLTNQSTFAYSSKNQSRTIFKLIETYLKDWSFKDQLNERSRKIRNNQLELIYSRIRQLDFELESELNETFKSSTSLHQLLDHTGRLINEMSTNCLIDLFRLLTLILNEDTQNELIKRIIEVLRTKFDQLKYAEILNCLEIINQYQINPYETDYLIQSNQNYLINFYNALLQLVKQEIRNHKLDVNDFELIIRYFSFFLSSDASDLDFEMVNYLANMLLSSSCHLNFKEAVLILRVIKFNHQSYKESTYFGKRENDLLLLNKLVDKCNSIVFRTLNSKTSKSSDYFYYLANIHDFINPINFDFYYFYDPKLLDLLAPYLIDQLKAGKNYRNFIFNLVLNYSKFCVYHEELLKFFYDLCCTDVKLVPKMAILNYFYLFSKYRLPFVDVTLLATKLLLNTSGYYNNAAQFNKKNTFKILCELILYDVDDERLLIYFDLSSDRVERDFFKDRTNRMYKELALAKVYLVMFSRLNENLKTKLFTKLEQTLNTISELNRRPIINYKFLRKNDRLQSTGFLSNGVHLDKFAIYDKTKQDLISLSKFKDYFDKVDKIPLNENQELLTFIEFNPIRGNIPAYEENFAYQLKRVLKHYKIKPIEVAFKQINSISDEEKVNFFIQKALKSYQ